MATLNDAYQGMANVNLWFKTRTGDKLVLSDVPSIIPLRWPYFRDNWSFIKTQVQKKVPGYSNPDFLNQQIIDFTSFIDSQRVSAPSINPFSDASAFYKFYAVFDNIFIQGINLSNEETNLVNNVVATVTAYSKNDFLKIKQDIIDYRDRYADIVNLHDPDYNRVFGKSSIPPQLQATLTDVQYLLNLENGIRTVDFILSNLFAVDAALDPFALARANANNPDVAIGSYSSGTLVKFSVGDSLEDLAQRYFGDPNKWIDIAIANGLKPPYIDEIGQAIPLLANGNGNQINIAETDTSGNPNFDKFYINQVVYLQSTTQVFVDQRTIINLRQIPVSGEIILELDGAANLSNYRTVDGANIRVYLPNTVNSMLFVLIPGNDPIQNDRKEETPWFLAKSAEDEKRCKIDLAVDESGELNFTTNGDLQLSFGLANALQALKFKIVTELGSLRFHPTFGLVNVIGQKNNDPTAIKTLITQSINKQVASDPRFDRIETLSVQYLVNNQTNTGVAAYAISMSVRLAGGSTVIPISFSINR